MRRRLLLLLWYAMDAEVATRTFLETHSVKTIREAPLLVLSSANLVATNHNFGVHKCDLTWSNVICAVPTCSELTTSTLFGFRRGYAFECVPLALSP